jgi:hypothetical protein
MASSCNINITLSVLPLSRTEFKFQQVTYPLQVLNCEVCLFDVLRTSYSRTCQRSCRIRHLPKFWLVQTATGEPYYGSSMQELRCDYEVWSGQLVRNRIGRWYELISFTLLMISKSKEKIQYDEPSILRTLDLTDKVSGLFFFCR